MREINLFIFIVILWIMSGVLIAWVNWIVLEESVVITSALMLVLSFAWVLFNLID